VASVDEVTDLVGVIGVANVDQVVGITGVVGVG
jgi:hypothetical protein